MQSVNVPFVAAYPRATPSSIVPAPRLPEATTLTADEIRRIVHDIVG